MGTPVATSRTHRHSPLGASTCPRSQAAMSAVLANGPLGM